MIDTVLLPEEEVAESEDTRKPLEEMTPREILECGQFAGIVIYENSPEEWARIEKQAASRLNGPDKAWWKAEERRRQQLQRESEVEDAREDREKFLRFLRQAGCPHRHQMCIDEGRYRHQPELDLLSDLPRGFVAVLHGTNGTGKTQLAVQLINQRCANHRGSRFAQAADLFTEIKSTFRKHAETSERNVLAHYQAPSLLVLDECHQRLCGEWEQQQLTRLINDRYNRLCDTVFICNLPEAQLPTHFGPNIWSRIIESGGCIEMNTITPERGGQGYS